MNNLLSQVTPLTKGLLWLTNTPVVPGKPFYKEVDYLLNGLLTATLKGSDSSHGHVLVGENFGQTFYVYVGSTDTEKNIRSFFELLAPQMGQESNLVLIDEMSAFPQLQKIAPAEIRNKIQVTK